MAPKPKKADSNTSSSGNEKVIKKAKEVAEIKKIINPNNTKNAIGNQIKGAILTGPLIGAAVGKVIPVAAKAIGGRVSEAVIKGSTKGFGSSGMGGKIYTAGGLEGKMIASTKVGSAAEGAAKMGNLFKGKLNEAAATTADLTGQAVRGMNMAGKIVKMPAAVVVAGKVTAPKKKKK